MKTPSRCLKLVAFGLLVASSTARAEVCRLMKDGETELPSEVAKACIAQAITAQTVPAISVAAIRKGPEATKSFDYQEVVHCRYVKRDQGGQSKKFRCARTDADGRIYNDDGTIEPSAVSVNDADELLDASGKPIIKAGKKKAEQADVMKVRFQDGGKRNRENYTNAAATRFFWALGIPAERVYGTAEVVCIGCGKDPFKQSKAESTTTKFPLAAIERKFNAKKVAEQTWSYDRLFEFYPTWTAARKDELESLVLADNLVHAMSTSSFQNELVCLSTGVNKETGECTQPVAKIHDLGAAFGNRKKKDGFLGIGAEEAPRGDYKAYAGVKIFKKKEKCELWLKPSKKMSTLSEAGRKAFVARAASLGREEVRMIFVAAHFERVDLSFRKKVAEELKVDDSSKLLDETVIDRWTDRALERLEEIRTADCTGSAQSQTR